MNKLTTDAGLEVIGYLNAGVMWKENLMRIKNLRRRCAGYTSGGVALLF